MLLRRTRGDTTTDVRVIFKFARPGSVIKQEPRAPIQSQKNSFLVKRMTRGIRSLLRVSEDKVLNLYGECFHTLHQQHLRPQLQLGFNFLLSFFCYYNDSMERNESCLTDSLAGAGF
jgi:hypothetical protein